MVENACFMVNIISTSCGNKMLFVRGDKIKLLLKQVKQGVLVVECHCITSGSTYGVNRNKLFQ